MEDRFDKLEKKMDDLGTEFREFKQEVNERFGQVDKTFGQVDKRFEQVDKRLDKIDKRLSEVEAGVVNNTITLQELQKTVNTTAETINKLYNKIDNFLVTAQKNEREIAVIAHRQREHEDRITALESKIA